MDTEVLTSLPMDDVSQTLAINEAGTSLAEMLQTESILLAAETHRRNRTESTSSTSSALQQLLTSDSITVPILGNSSSIVTKCQLKQSGGYGETSPYAAVTPSRQRFTQALLLDTGTAEKHGFPSHTEHVSLAQILQAPSESQSRVAEAISQFAALPEECMELNLNEGLESGYIGLDVLNMGDSANLDIGTFPLFSTDDGMLFENGIAASDVGSLLEQFEEAASNLMVEPVGPVAVQSEMPVPLASQPEDAEPNLGMQPPALPPATMQPADVPFLAVPIKPEPVTPLPAAPSITTIPKNEPAGQRHSLVNPESEVVKLLKAKRRVPPIQTMPSPAPTPPATPPPEIIEKIKASNKRKSAIMLADAVPAKGDRGGRAVTLPDYSTRKMKKMDTPTKPVPVNLQSTKVELSPFKLEEALLRYSNSEPNSACSSSGENSRSSSPAFGGPVRKRQKITISQYKDRMKSRDNSRESSPQRTTPITRAIIDLHAYISNQPVKQSPVNQLPAPNPSPSVAAAAPATPSKLNVGYFRLIADHDYCQNVPVSEEIRIKETASRSSSPARRDLTDMEVVSGTENTPATPKSAEVSVKEGKTRKNKNSVLKSLLLNSNLAEELKVQAQKDRVFTMRNMNGKHRNTKDSLAVVAMDMETEENEEEEAARQQRFSKFAAERKDLNSNKVNQEKSDKFVSNHGGRTRRHYRGKRSSSPEHDANEPLFDKLPNYCTALSVPNQPGAPKPVRSLDKLVDRSLPFRDRDPSPDRSDPTFDKLPAYHSCFTNSTKYDRAGFSRDPLGLDADVERPLSAQSSRSQTPNLVIASRMTSRATSRAASPVSRATSRSRSRSYSRTRSHSRTRSRSPVRRRRRRSRRLSERRARKRSASSSSSSSNDRSCRRHRSSSSSSSGSRSRSRSRRGRRRDRSRSHSRSRDTSWIKWKEEQRIKREDEKRQQIEERRIIYVGRIPSEFSRRDLRRKFGRFGDIEEASVHMREHGDNYGFVTYSYTCDAYAAIEKGNSITGCERFDLCFGGRRDFCKSDYADLDGNMEDDEEMGPVMAERNAPLDFDALLRQATQKLNKKKH